MSYDRVLSEIYDSTYKMLELAQGKQWRELIQAENDRSELLHKLTMHNNLEITSEVEAEKKLKEIIGVNQLITFLSIQEKDSCLSEFKQAKTSRKAASEYSRY